MDIMAYVKAYLQKYKPYKPYWSYEDGCVLKGSIDLYRATGDETFKTFAMDFMNRFVNADGVITNYDLRQYSVDSINCSKALFFALEETGEEKWRRAIEYTMQRLREHPRCACGSFWHKEAHPYQLWLDGLYMASPFYMEYEMKLGGMEKMGDVVRQFRNAREHLWNAEKGLYHHAWDEGRLQAWADPETGLSASFWLRAMGWYLMALVDAISLCTEQLYEHYRALVDIFREAVRGVLPYQAEDGLFYQVVDHPEAEGNYTESSGSAMIAYAILKGVQLGLLDPEKYLPIGRGVFEALVQHKLQQGADGVVRLMDICLMAGMGTGDNPRQDGSVAYYLSEPKNPDDSKGVGAFMMALAQYMTCQ